MTIFRPKSDFHRGHSIHNDTLPSSHECPHKLPNQLLKIFIDWELQSNSLTYGFLTCFTSPSWWPVLFSEARIISAFFIPSTLI